MKKTPNPQSNHFLIALTVSSTIVILGTAALILFAILFLNQPLPSQPTPGSSEKNCCTCLDCPECDVCCDCSNPYLNKK